MKKILLILSLVLMLSVFLTSCNQMSYNKALKLIENGNYEEARVIFSELGIYQDSQKYLRHLHYIPVSINIQRDGQTATTEVEIGRNGLPANVKHVDSGKETLYSFTYNSNGDLKKLSYTSYTGDVLKVSYTYDETGRLVSETQSNGALESTTVSYSYDSKDNVSKVVRTGLGGQEFISESEYDSYGNIIRRTDIFSETDKVTVDYIYSGAKLTKAIYHYSDTVRYTEEYTYDSNGRLSMTMCIYTNGDQASCEYTYDENGNVTKKTVTDEMGGQTVYEYTYKLVYTSAEYTKEEIVRLLDQFTP